MLNPRYLLFSFFVLKYFNEVYAMDCNAGGLVFHCPGSLQDSDKMFCCKSSISSTVDVCCDAKDYLKENPGVLVGLIIGILAIVIAFFCCCCCCCCCLAKRREHRGIVLYGSVTPSTASSVPYQVLHSTHNQVSNPPPYYQQSANPYFNTVYQPPTNPDYK